jgi:hypothetical protein
MTTPDAHVDRIRLDYQQTTDLLRTLTDVRFKLLAFVPTIAGAAVGLFGRPRPAVELLAIGLLGLFATLGTLLYELRNTQMFNYAVARSQRLEAELGTGGLYLEQPDHRLRLFGIAKVAQESGLALVYGAALAGWSYLVAWGGLRALDVGSARKLGVLLGVVAGALIALEIRRIDAQPSTASTSDA